ncbi:hypothetical protein HUG10_20815 (plasmid) [Halorarum halophilum]|uniref:DUF8160 domain-containing protein n=1 Tax=Halorarum halophilum TaxID=2743090 RepID=A0A7D5GPQ4_9EURY|nr:hypothetical protein [Halobaculum halophilum]QLG30047.1 hypothetical protein HUG10_20815 [Halobaculum halophilum]
MPEEDDDELASMMKQRHRREEDDGAERETGTDAGGGTSEESTRSRSQCPMYLSEQLQGDLDRTFKRYNAKRTLDGDDEVEKHKHFLEGLVRAGLDHPDLDEYIMEEYES